MLSGLLIGIGMILPGVSGGVIAVILGIYDKVIYYLNNFRKNIKESMRYLIPLILGIVIGTVLSAKLLNYVFDKYYTESCYLFIGLILGSVPYLIKDSNKKDEKGINYGVLIITFLVSVIISIICRNNFDFSSKLDGGLVSIIKLFSTGVLFIAGKIIPGISSSFSLMMIGMYDYLLKIMSDPINAITHEFLNLIPMGLGLVIGGFALVKLMGVLLDKCYSLTYSVIIGFVIGSVVVILPERFSIIGSILFILGCAVSYYFSTKERG